MTTKEATKEEVLERLEDILAKATPYGPGFKDFDGEVYVDKYLIPAGPLHRAMGLLVGIRSSKSFPLKDLGVNFTLKSCEEEQREIAEAIQTKDQPHDD